MVLAFSQHLRRRNRRSMERDPSIRSKRNDSRFRYPAVRNIPTICTPHLPSPLLLSGRPNSGSTTRSKLTFRIPATDPKRRQCPQSRPDCHRQPIQPNQCHQRYVQSLYQAYYLTQQETYAKRLHELLQLLLNTPVSDAVLFADNFGSTNIAYCFLKPYDLLYKRLSSEERQSVENLLMRVLRFYYPQQQGTQENRIFDNHFWQQNLRVLFQATFLLYDNEALQDEVLPIMEYYYELWTARAPASGFNRDGMWANGTGYFNNNVYTLFYMPMLLSHITRKDFLLHPWYRNAGQALTFTCPPESRNIGFGDNSENIPRQPTNMRLSPIFWHEKRKTDMQAGMPGKRQRL